MCPLPVVSSVTPVGGLVSGGQTVTVTGSRFKVGITATIGGVVVTPSRVSATSFTFTSPAETAGAVHVQLTTKSGQSQLTPAADDQDDGNSGSPRTPYDPSPRRLLLCSRSSVGDDQTRDEFVQRDVRPQ